MLKLKPNCECCNKDLPVDSPEAMICTFECTFCRDCVEINKIAEFYSKPMQIAAAELN